MSPLNEALIVRLEKFVDYLADELHEVEKVTKDIAKDISELKTEQAVQKVKSGMWGAISGALTALGMIAIFLFKEYLKKP